MRMDLAAVVCAALACALPATSAAADVRMGKSAEYPHAGLSLAVPKQFTPVNVYELYDVMRAVLRENDKLVQGVTVSLFPIGKKKTHAQFAEDMLAEMKRSLAIRQFKLIKTAPVRIADQPGTGCRMQYTFRGVQTMAARVFFTRDVASTGGRLCYVLTIESSPKHEALLLPTLDAVMKSFKLSTIRRPAAVAVSEVGPAVEDSKHGFVVCPPRGWFVAALPAGLQVAQTDYTAGCQPTATLQITVGLTPVGVTSKLLARHHLAKAARTFPAGKTLWQGPVTLAGLKGYQFVLHQAPGAKRPPSGPPGAKRPAELKIVTIVQTVLCVPAAGKLPARTYDLVLLCHGGKPEVARATMDRIAPTFKLLDRAKPTTRPKDAAATKPAAKAPK